MNISDGVMSACIALFTAGCAAPVEQDFTITTRVDSGASASDGTGGIVVDDDTGTFPIFDVGRPDDAEAIAIDAPEDAAKVAVADAFADAAKDAADGGAKDSGFLAFDAGCGDDASAKADETGTSCPSGMISLSAPCGASRYCIDADEVTNEKYATFVTAKGSDTTGQPAYCAWNVDYKPTGGLPTGKDKHPVIAIDWCDAYAYCAWSGKHLCGKIGGGANAPADTLDPKKDEWFNACSSGGSMAYPYGNAYKPSWCNDKAFLTPAATVLVRQASGCLTSGIYDLSGNAYEWTNTCDGETGKDDLCHRRGGSFNNDVPSDLACTNDRTSKRSETFTNLGFRCCK